MPTYEYKCDVCGNTFDLFQSIKAEPIKKCPKCGGHVKRLIGAGAGVIFKGSGFYSTDYRSENYKRDAKKDKEIDKIPPSNSDKTGSSDKASSSDKKDQA
jgi:putative FmdB family regulatory protein